MKENVCGITGREPGENLWNAICKTNNVSAELVGIPNYRIPEAIEVLKEFLSPDDVVIVRMGYGLGTTRLTQKEIAEELGLDRNEVSRRMTKAVEKLSRTSARSKLREMVPTTVELYDAFMKRQDNTALIEQAKKDARAITGYQAGIKERNSKILRLSEGWEASKRETAALRKRLEDAEAEIKRLKAENLRLKAEKQRFAAEKNWLSDAMPKIEEFARRYRVGFIDVAEKELARVLDGEDEIREALKRAGITDLDALCMCSEKNLIDLRVSQSFIAVIEQKLAEHGLKLRTA